MRHGILACAGAAVLGITMLWPAAADAQHRRGGRAVVRVAPAARAVRVVRPVYSRGIYYSYSRYYSPYSFYWGWGHPWYSYPYFYGPYGDPFWYGGWGPWGPWSGYRYYDNHASVRIQAAPREAQVYVDGYFVGVVDDFDGTFQRLRLPPGGHEITLHLNGYRNAVEKMYLQPRSTYRVRARLEPLPSGAPPEPLPVPNPDAIRSPEEERGAEYEAEPAGPPSRRWPPRQQAEEQQRQREQRDARFGTLTIRVQPPDAEVIVDETPWRGPAAEDGAISIQVAAGQHRVEIRREGYASFVTQVEVRAGVTTPLNVMLQRED